VNECFYIAQYLRQSILKALGYTSKCIEAIPADDQTRVKIKESKTCRFVKLWIHTPHFTKAVFISGRSLCGQSALICITP
jgi:hypothetical protein